jgi:hypothetical protein
MMLIGITDKDVQEPRGCLRELFAKLVDMRSDYTYPLDFSLAYRVQGMLCSALQILGG